MTAESTPTERLGVAGSGTVACGLAATAGAAGIDVVVWARSDAYNSVGGFVFGELGRLPKRGDMVRSNGYSLRVESVRANRIEAVRIRDHEDRGGSGGASRDADGDEAEPAEEAAAEQ